MSRLNEVWVLLRENPPEYDESTGNFKPVPPSEVECRGLLQQRNLTASSVDSGNTQIAPKHLAGTYDLLLEPQFFASIPIPQSGESMRGPDGDYTVTVSRPRSAPRRNPKYIAVIVKSSSDMKGSTNG